MTTPAAPPPTSAQPPGLDDLIPGLKKLWWVAGVIGAGFALYYGVIIKVERLTDKADAAAEAAKHAASASSDSREASERSLREYKAQADARIAALENSATMTVRRVDVLEERMNAIGKTADQIYTRQEVLLDRLNPPRPRVVRDFPQ